MSTVFLKVKIKSLAEESRIIRKEERKRWGHDPMRRRLSDHRRFDVRKEARDSLLAYGYLRGRSMQSIEASSHNDPNWKNVQRMVEKYGPPKHNVAFEDWKAGRDWRKTA